MSRRPAASAPRAGGPQAASRGSGTLQTGWPNREGGSNRKCAGNAPGIRVAPAMGADTSRRTQSAGKVGRRWEARAAYSLLWEPARSPVRVFPSTPTPGVEACRVPATGSGPRKKAMAAAAKGPFGAGDHAHHVYQGTERLRSPQASRAPAPVLCRRRAKGGQGTNREHGLHFVTLTCTQLPSSGCLPPNGVNPITGSAFHFATVNRSTNHCLSHPQLFPSPQRGGARGGLLGFPGRSAMRGFPPHPNPLPPGERGKKGTNREQGLHFVTLNYRSRPAPDASRQMV